MARTKISEFSATPASNTDIDSIFIGEGMAPSNVNDAIRELMAQLKDFQVGSAGDPVTVGGVLTVQAGSASTPALTTAGDTNTGMFFPAADTIAFAEGGAEVARFDSSGNLGLGVTPSAWGSSKAIEIGGAKGNAIWNFNNSSGDIRVTANAYFNGSSFIYGATNAASAYTQNGGSHSWSTAPSGTAGNAITFTQAMTLDASGNLGIGTTSPQAPLHVKGTNASEILRLESTDTTGDCYIRYTDPNGAKGYIGYVESATNNFAIHNTLNTPMLFYTNNTERARFDSSGNLIIGQTATPLAGDGQFFNSTGRWTTRQGGGGIYAQFLNSSGTEIGRISNNSNAATVFSTTSDYRLKEEVTPMTGALVKITALNPVSYKWKSTGDVSQGFIAHELQAVIPDAVVGEKDAVDEDGNPQYQSIDTSFLVATLTAAIKELKAEFDAYKASHP